MEKEGKGEFVREGERERKRWDVEVGVGVGVNVDRVAPGSDILQYAL